MRHLLFAAVLLSALPLSAAEVLRTDPVGFVTLGFAGLKPKAKVALSFRALPLTPPIALESTAVQVGANSLVGTAPGWPNGQFNNYLLEITGPPGAAGIGTSYDVTASSGQTFQLAQNLAPGIAVGATFRLRQHWMLASVFGASNENGLTGGTEETADQVLIWNGTAYDAYYYSTGGAAGTGWRKKGDNVTNYAGFRLYPDQGLVIQRLGQTKASLILTGSVKTGATSSPVVAGLNFLANPYAAKMTLASSGLYTGDATTGLAPGTAKTADQVLLWNGTAYRAYYYSNGGAAGKGWREAGDNSTNRASTPIPLGSAFVVKRQAATGFDWLAPQHPARF